MRKVWPIFLAALLLRIFLSFGPYHPDLGNHLDWGIKFWQLGPKFFYENQFWQVSWANQPPGTIYVFALSRKIYEMIFAATWWLNLKIPAFPSFLIPLFQEKLYAALIKLPAILADLGIAYFIFKFLGKIKDERTGRVGAAIFLFNPVIWYNSAVWGQTDAWINFFALWAGFLFWRKKPLWGIFIFLASLYFKGSLLILLPVFLILLWKAEVTWWKKLTVALTTPIFFAYLSFPFVRWQSPIPWLYHLYRDRIFGHQGNMLTANAFNLWALLFGIDFSRNDLGVSLGLTLKNWGQILFLVTSVAVLVKLLKQKKENLPMIFWAIALEAVLSFDFLTNMHERYLYPALPYLTMLLYVVPNLGWLYCSLSLIFFLNLYHLWYVPDVFSLRLLFTPWAVKILALANLSLGLWFFFKFFRFFCSQKV